MPEILDCCWTQLKKNWTYQVHKSHRILVGNFFKVKIWSKEWMWVLSSQRYNCNLYLYLYLFVFTTNVQCYLIWGQSSSIRIFVGDKASYIGLKSQMLVFRILNLQRMFQSHRQLAASVPGGDLCSNFLTRAFL